MYYLWLCWVFASARGLSLAVANGSYSLVVVQGLLIPVVSPVVEHGLCGVLALVVVVHRLSRPLQVEPSGTRDWTASPALADIFLTTGPPGKSWAFLLNKLQNVKLVKENNAYLNFQYIRPKYWSRVRIQAIFYPQARGKEWLRLERGIRDESPNSHREWTCGCLGRRGKKWGRDWELEISRCKLLYTEWVNNKVLCIAQGTIFNILW